MTNGCKSTKDRDQCASSNRNMTTLTTPTAMTCTTSGKALHIKRSHAHNGPMPRRDPARKTISVRVTKATAERMRLFLRDYCGKPLYLKPGEFVEKAILREIQRLEMVLSGALPMDGDERVILPPEQAAKVKRPVGVKITRLNAVRVASTGRGEDNRHR